MINFLFKNTPLMYLTQSIWRDEGFSYFMARPNIIQVIKNSINDFNPPFYYIMLHFWMKLFGESDIALRMLSFIFHILTVYFAFLLFRKLFGERFGWWAAAFTFLNPMLLYYGFELRMYSVFAFFTMASTLYFIEKRWRRYVIVTTLGIYTHSFFLLIILSQLLYLYITKQLIKKSVKYVLTPVVFFLPWLPFLIWQFGQSKNTWIYPVNIQLVFSSLGNLFVGYEGTPGGLWVLTFALSLVLILFIYSALKKGKKIGYLAAIYTLFPLGLVLLYSIIRRPIYVNRYLIFVTVGEILAISSTIGRTKVKKLRYIWMGFWLIFIIVIDLISVSFHKKINIRATIMEISRLAKSDDVVYTQTPLVYFESAFYFPDKERVFIYNPKNITIPKYIGTAVIPKEKSMLDFPESPARTFLVQEDGSFEVIMKKVNSQ